MTTTPRRHGRRRAAEEPPTTGSAAVDAEPDPESVARTIALRELTGAPRSRAQLRATMAKRDVPQDVTERVLDRFEEVGLLDDAEYARTWVRSRHTGRGLARRALAHELASRGIAPELAAEALDQVDEGDELQAARALVARRLAATRGLDHDVRVRRLVGMLARKGYSSTLALRVVKGALAIDSEDLDKSGGPPG